MPLRQVRVTEPAGKEIGAALADLRAELDVPLAFRADVLEDAARAARAPLLPRADATEVPFATIDPEGSRDLDQAFHVERAGGGFRVRYAIADVGAFVQAGGPLDREAHVRGQTLYAPDENALLHPRAISEGAGSLLAGETRPALVWTMEVDATGEGTDVTVRRALVRSRAQLTYVEAQRALDEGNAEEPLALLREVGLLRQEREARRGGVELPLPEQIVEKTARGYALRYRAPLPVERWNAQISLLTGMAAAELMLGARVGVLRTLPAPDPRALARLHRTAKALGIAWPDETPYGALVRALDPREATSAAFISESTVLLRGSAYLAFDGTAPVDSVHAGVASTYTHATAPLRRLVDRYVGETCLAVATGAEVPTWVRETLPSLPETMDESNRRARRFETGIVSIVEAAVLAPRLGEVFPAVVVDVDEREGGGVIQLTDPAVAARCTGTLPLGGEIEARLEVADVSRRLVRFALA